jgi:tRNA A-37 threonylcarbamoyl transferase component Bud32
MPGTSSGASAGQHGLLPAPSVLSPGLPYTTDPNDLWYYAGMPTSARQGWKLYVSFSPFDADTTLSALVPIIARHTVYCKYLKRRDDLMRLNAGVLGYSQIGKCLVCYVPEQNDWFVRDLIGAVEQCGIGPVVPFARGLRRGLPLYYRFGSYCDSHIFVGGSARPDNRLSFAAAVPEGVYDWLAAYAGPSEATTSFQSFLFQYPVYGALRQQGKAGVFCGLNLRSTRYQEVIVKVAYRYGGLQADGSDGRTFLRNEIRVYEALASNGLKAVAPTMIDSYDDGENVALVLLRLSGDDLLTLKLRGRLTLRLVMDAWMLLERLHQRGFFVGDAKLANFVTHDDGCVYIIDFEGARTPDSAFGETRVLRTFRLRLGYTPESAVLDKLHFLVSVVFQYHDPSLAPWEYDPVVDVREYAARRPNSDIDEWATAQLAAVLGA